MDKIIKKKQGRGRKLGREGDRRARAYARESLRCEKGENKHTHTQEKDEITGKVRKQSERECEK